MSFPLLAFTAACFSEPPTGGSPAGTTEVASNDTGIATSGAQSSGDVDPSDGSTGLGSSSTGFFLPTSTGLDTLGETGALETGNLPAIVFDFYADCGAGTWQATSDTDGLIGTTCMNNASAAHSLGGGWRFPMYGSPTFGAQENVLVLRPSLAPGGVVQASYQAGMTGIQDGDILRLDYEFVNTSMMSSEVGSMTFQVLVNDPQGQPENAVVIEEVFGGGSDTSGMIDVPLEIAPGEELTFFVLADASVEDQGVALYDAVVVRP